MTNHLTTTPRPYVPGAEADAADALLNGELAIAVLDVDGQDLRLAWVNQAFSLVTGYTLLTAGRQGQRLFSEDYDVSVQLLAKGQEGRPFALTIPLVRADGHEVAVPANVTPRLAANGRLRRLVVVQREGVEPVAGGLPLELEYHSRHALEVVARVSDLLAEVDDSEVLMAIAGMLTRNLFAWCAFVTDNGVLSFTESLDGAPVRVDRRPVERRVPDPDDPVERFMAGTTMRRLRLDLDEPRPPGSMSAQIVDLVRPQRSLHPTSQNEVLLLPLLGRGRTMGMMAVLPFDRSAGGDEPGTVLELVARRVGLAMDNAQLYRGEHLMAETLQRAMLPEQDLVEGLDVWTYYAPNSEHAQVGGDWYDVVHLEGDVVAIVVGDVVGHDVAAAASMGQYRSVVRAFAAEDPEPGSVLTRVDRIAQSMRIPRPASVLYAVLDPYDDAEKCWAVRYSRAGHLPGLVLHEGQVNELDGAGGRLLGFGEHTRETAVASVCPGDVMVLYTDGLVERRSRPVQDGVSRLKEALLDMEDVQDAAEVGERLLMHLGEEPEDDIAVVVIRFPESHGGTGAGGGRRVRWRLSPHADSVGVARRRVVQTAREWGHQAQALEMVASELVANAVVHGWGTVAVSLRETRSGLRLEVEDGNPVPPTSLEVHPARVGGYGMHVVARLADWGWRPSGAGKVVWALVRPGIDEVFERPEGGVSA